MPPDRQRSDQFGTSGQAVGLLRRSKAVSRPPRPHPPEIANIPPELKERRSWLPWRFSEKPNQKGKFSKVPFSITDRKADYTNPLEWQMFDTVMQQYERGNYDGIGLVLGDGLCGLDEDHCCQDGHLSEESARHIRVLNSYSEFSVSGDGVHCLAFGTLPDGPRKRGNHELYGDQRFFVVTGRKLPSSPGFIAHRAAELKQLHAMLFGTPEQNRLNDQNQNVENQGHKCPKTKRTSVPKLAPITQGERGKGLSDKQVLAQIKKDPVAQMYWPGCPGGVNPSEADFALACKLAFYCRRNLQQMERLFRQSALAARAKADTRRGDIDYITYTLRRACKKQAEVWQPEERAKSPNPPGRPRCTVNPEEVTQLRATGQSWRAIARKLKIGTATAIRLCNSVPKTSQNPEVALDKVTRLATCSDGPALEVGIPWEEWQARTLNRLFQEQGVTGQPGRITAATVRHGDRVRRDRPAELEK